MREAFSKPVGMKEKMAQPMPTNSHSASDKYTGIIEKTGS